MLEYLIRTVIIISIVEFQYFEIPLLDAAAELGKKSAWRSAATELDAGNVQDYLQMAEETCLEQVRRWLAAPGTVQVAGDFSVIGF